MDTAHTIAGALGLTLLVAMRRRGWAEALGWALVPWFALLVLVSWFDRVYLRPVVPSWDAARLTAALVVRRGLPLYPNPENGSVLSWFYGPVAAYAYFPATLPRQPTAMVLAGRCVSVLYFFGPWAWCFLREAKRGGRSVVAVLGFLLAATIAEGSPSLRYASTAILADNPALSLGTLALLALGVGQGRPGTKRLLMVLSAAALAAWSKQLAAPLMVLVVVWCFWIGGWRLGLKALALGMVVSLACTALFVWTFGPRELVFGLIQVLRAYPYRIQGLGPIVQDSLHAFQPEGGLILGLLGAAGLAAWGQRTTLPQGWTLLPLWALVGLPLSCLAYVKVGGDVNSLAFVTGPLLLAATWLTARCAAKGGWAFWGMLVLVVVVGVARDTGPGEGAGAGEPAWLREQRQTMAYLRAHPGAAYFPERPLEHLAIEGRFTHQEYGLMDRERAGFPLTHDQIWRGIPPRARRLVYPGGLTYAGFFAQRSLVEFAREVQDPELPGALVYERE